MTKETVSRSDDMKELINTEKLIQGITALKSPGELFEIRILDNNSKKAIVGFFKETEVLLNALKKVDTRGKNLYITVNAVDEDLYSTTPHDRFVLGATSTSDNDVTRYEWLFIDLDPVRKSGISSSNEELQKSVEVANTVREWLQSRGFHSPLTAMSGNGTHLLYKIDLPVTDESKALVKRCLEVLAELFNTDSIKIDTVNYNPARICKLYGTLAQKGADTEKRPHRMSHIIANCDGIVNDVSLLRDLAGDLPEKPQPARMVAPTRTEFVLTDWLTEHGITYFSTGKAGGGSIVYNLDECPFDPSHTHGDAKIFQYSDGAIAFKCHHNSCQQYKWQDLREKFEPGVYDQQDTDDGHIDRGWQQHKLAIRELAEKEPPKKERKFRKLKTAAGILAKDLPDPVVFVGNNGDDALLVEGTCILSAKPKLGKSWFVLAMCLAIANGEDFVGYKTKQCSTLYLDLETSERTQQKRIRKMLGDRPVPEKFYLDTETDNLDSGFVEQIENYLVQDSDIGVVVVDVFQIIRSAQKGAKENEYEHAYRDLTPLNALAEKYHISIILVCHDRKMVDSDDPFANILGSTGIQGAATQMIVMFKPKKDSPIHISVKGKNIDSLPELDVELNEAQWTRKDAAAEAEASKQKQTDEYFASNIREAVVRLCKQNGGFYGRCGELPGKASAVGIGITDSAKEIGRFLTQMTGHFMTFDRIAVQAVNNGTGGKYYRIHKFTVDTVDGTVDEYEQSPVK